ncbi:hypothetical protein BD780_000558 [Clostridium tetanomorphum]|uniref:DUF3793 family protein n=1 Tax=Clostridium tetanomorphum TaxID=1553 RepID=A0A923E9T0_CLOTT|nr:DUF3793 family protein [Clostridium tetanomorphum]KAJ51832.1 hypothetical protein CTM_11218 [Clostridium tetanomorphum DSM 665]MBC2397714.1 DUF3793 family protein [Clostridium tetanomorphum]MBP1865069.1 hypothetical protein [Clostridium tetanomorphum]NRS83333.1 hypothetical protein [Clostridium tetanomorphum]NRZ96533.1 hypothetical protein [Clostridium tetanomorphum]
MSKLEMASTLKMINTLQDKEYMFYMTAFNIAPTIEGRKPACILTFSKKNRNLYDMWEKYKEEFLERFDIKAFHIKDTGDTHTVLFYKEAELHNQIFKDENINFLHKFGYREYMKLEECLNLLKERYENFCPHEIGIFLGIPLEDVKAFMGCTKKPCLSCGYWKVYYNEEEALQIFKSYDEAKIKVLEAVRQQIVLNSFNNNIKI